MSLLEKVDSILTELENIKGMLNILVARPFKLVEKEPEPKKEPTVRRASPGFPFAEQKTEHTTDYMLPKTGKYQWYKLKGDDQAKLRKCNNEGCSMFLKFNGDKKKYEHWKYDANTGVGGYVQDTCDYYFPEGL